MSRFFVGQRVRIVLAYSLPQYIGTETRITGAHPIDVDAWWLDLPLHNGLRLKARSHQLEPILPEGHRPADLSVDELLPFLKTEAA